MGAVKEAMLNVVGSNTYQTSERFQQMDRELGNAHIALVRQARYVKSAKQDLHFKIDQCHDDWKTGRGIFYGEVLASEAARYERELAKYQVLESTFCDRLYAAGFHEDVVMAMILQARNVTR